MDAEPSKPRKGSAKRKPKAQGLTCQACGLWKNASSPAMSAHGEGKRGILWLGEASGAQEDNRGLQLVGDAGQLLQRFLHKVGMDLREDGFTLNGVNCFPGRGADGKLKAPTTKQVNCCRNMVVLPEVRELQPRFIVAMGNKALESLWGDQATKLTITKFRGRAIPDKRTGAWVLPIFHPSYILRNEGNKGLEKLFEADLRRVRNWVRDLPPPTFPDPEPQVEIVKDFSRLLEVLNILAQAPELVFDYETSGLKPWREGHCIHSIAAVPRFPGEGENTCYSFPFQYPGHFTPDQQATIARKWAAILSNPCIRKIAHNLKFEDMWGRAILDVATEGWHWCSMNNQHIIDNTSGTTSLKFQAMVRYGIIGYDDEFSKYAKGRLSGEEKEAGEKHESAHAFNRVHEMPLDSLLLYGGYDGVIEDWLYEDQREEIVPGSLQDTEARRLFHRALLCLADMQEEGVPVDMDYLREADSVVEEQLGEMEAQLAESREAQLFREKEGEPIDISNSNHIRRVLFDYMGLRPPKETGKGQASADADSLAQVDSPFARAVVDYRKLDRVRSTYFAQIMREAEGGKIHPFTNLHIPVTYRSSMDSPNLQNVPMREARAKLLVRRAIRVPPGSNMEAVDYGAIEVHGLEWYSRDRTLYDYLHNPGSDMHRDQCKAIFRLSDADWNDLDGGALKLLRFFAKNGLVFPLFYGSWHEPCAKNLWRLCADLPIGDADSTRVRDVFDDSFLMFARHVKGVEEKFWATFSGVRDWQNSIHREYDKKGYIETYLGFRYRGWLSRNDLYNYKIQGTAFHLLLWAMCEVHEESIRRGWKSYVMWQIHDQLVLALYPEEYTEVLEFLRYVMTVKARERFTWINTPLQVEYEITPVDGTFNDLAEFNDRDVGFDPTVLELGAKEEKVDDVWLNIAQRGAGQRSGQGGAQGTDRPRGGARAV